MKGAMLDLVTVLLGEHLYMAAKAAIGSYERINKDINYKPFPLHSWNEFFEAVAETQKAIMKSKITNEVLTAESFECWIRAAKWYSEHRK